MPVSYTHLDVYKRQWEDNAILLPLDGSTQPFVQHFDRKDWRVTVAQMEEQEKAKAGITPVSYTHLHYLIPAVAAETATGTGFYYAKAKVENRIKLMKLYNVEPTEQSFNEQGGYYNG